MTRVVFVLLVVLVVVALIGANLRGTIAEPATSALSTAVVIQQVTMCVIPLAVLIVLALGIVAYIVAHRADSVHTKHADETRTASGQPHDQVIAPSVPTPGTIINPSRVVRQSRALRSRAAGKLAARWFR